MIKNYLKVAIRQLSKNKLYVTINTLGMGVALACCLTAYLLVAFNIEFDSYLEKDNTKNLVKVMAHFEHKNGNQYQNMITPVVMAPIAAKELAGINNYTRFVATNGYMVYGDKVFSEWISFADETFFELFEIPFLKGSPQSFKNRETLILSEEFAFKYFGDEDPIGKSISLEFRNKKYEAIVGGVFKNIPQNTSFDMNVLIRIETFLDVFDVGPNEWGEWRDVSTIFQLQDINNYEEIGRQLDKYIEIRNQSKPDAIVTSYQLLPFNSSVDEDEANWSYLNNRIPFVPMLVFITMAIIILLIACFNLTNTTIATTLKRLKEIGVRKVVGAHRIQIINQMLLEIVVMLIIAVVVGFAISQIIVPEFRIMWGLEYGMREISTGNLFIAIVFLLFISAIIAGLYPALSSSNYKPVELLKGKSKVSGTNMLIRILLVAQFSLSIIVLIAGIIFTMNSQYQKRLSFGYNVNNVIVVSIQGPEEFEGLRNAISTYPKIEQVAVTDHHLGYGSYSNPVKIESEEFNTQVYEVGANYFNVMGMNIIEGRNFIEGSKLDFENSAIIDEEFVAFHNLARPLETKIWFQEVWYNVVGVVNNHSEELWKVEKVGEGHFYRVAKPEQYRRLVAKVKDGEELLTVTKYIEEQWKDIFPEKPFFSRTQEDVVYENASQTNRNLTIIFFFLTILGCLLSVSGIFSLAKLNIEKKTKEIGIRKVLGASVRNIVRLLNREFVIILAAAALIGGIGGFVLTEALLAEIYARYIEVGVMTIFFCGFSIFSVGISATSGVIIKAARNNPVNTLRDE